MYASSADLTGAIGASQVSGHARKRAILVRIPSLGGRLGTGRGGEGAFRRSRPLFRPLVRGKLISFIRGGDEGREREREEKGRGKPVSPRKRVVRRNFISGAFRGKIILTEKIWR